MELRTIIKVHFEELNKIVLELHDSQNNEDYEQIKAIKNTADKMYLPFLMYRLILQIQVQLPV